MPSFHTTRSASRFVLSLLPCRRSVVLILSLHQRLSGLVASLSPLPCLQWMAQHCSPLRFSHHPVGRFPPLHQLTLWWILCLLFSLLLLLHLSPFLLPLPPRTKAYLSSATSFSSSPSFPPSSLPLLFWTRTWTLSHRCVPPPVSICSYK